MTAAEAAEAEVDAARRSEAEPKADPETGGTLGSAVRASADEDSGVLASGETSEDFGRRQIVEYHNVQMFFGAVHSENGTIGIAQGKIGPGERGSPRSVGRVDEISIHATRRGCVPPDGYSEARDALDRDHVVILEGPRGTGRRFGAVSLLRDCTDGPLRDLSPTMTVEDLSGHPYERGHGYVVDLQDTSWKGQADFGWHAVCHAVRDSGAELVVTCEPGALGMLEAVKRTLWSKPDLNRFLELNSTVDTDRIEHVLSAREHAETSSISMAGWKRIADRAEAGVVLEQAIADEAGSAARYAVSVWFDQKCLSRDALAEVTALLFLPKCPLREFEEETVRLAELLAEHGPAEAPGEVPALMQAPPAQKRAARLADGSLITVTRGYAALPGWWPGPEGGFGEMPAFCSSEYRRYVADALWARMDSTFWNTVRRWLTEFAERSTDFTARRRLGVAEGLAVVATASLSEVQESYLEPWSTQYSSLQTQTMAGWVLMAMASAEDLSVTALRIAIRWGASSAWRQQWSATLACSGELGAQYPVEAAECLIRLLAYGARALRGFPGRALGSLFAQAALRPPEAGAVLRLLASEVDSAGADRDHRARVLSATLTVVSARHGPTQRSAVLMAVDADPNIADLLVRLWVAVLLHRPLRARAIDALIHAVTDLPGFSAHPDERCVLLARLSADALSVGERAALRHDLGVRYRRTRPETLAADPVTAGSLIRIFTDLLGPSPLTGARL